MAPLNIRRRLMCDRGAELIEFALVTPLLLLLVFGVANFGLMFQRYEVLTNAAREGARVAALPTYGSADVTNRVTQYLAGSGVTVCVNTRNSPRSFTRVRRAITPTGAVALNVKLPVNGVALNGASFRNFAVCVLPSRTRLFCPKSFPLWSVKLNVMVTGELFGF